MKMKKGIAALSCLLAMAIPANALAAVEKNEIVYANLNADGSGSQVIVVNRFESDEAQQVTDYGKYSNLTNLTSLDALTQQQDQVSFSMQPGTFYYQGEMIGSDLPWNFAISYQMDGESLTPEEMAGRSGKAVISIDIVKNPAVNPMFFEKYLLSMSVTLDGEKFKEIGADSANMANSGQNRLLSYTLMPDEEHHLIIAAQVTEFELPPITINAIPMSMDIGEVDTTEIKDQIAELQDGIGQMDDGAGQLADATSKLKKGTGSLYQGSTQVRKGISTLSGGADQLFQGASQIELLMNAMIERFGQLQSAAGQISQNSQGLNAGAAQLSEGLNALNTQYQAVSGAVSDLKKAVSALAAAAGGCDQDIANLKKLIGVVSQYPDLASDYAKYIASGKRLMGTMELLDAGLSQLNQKIGDFETALNQVGAAINQLNEGAKTLNGGIGQYTGAVDQLSGAINGVDLSDAAPQIQLFCQGMESLDKGLNELKSSYEALHQGIATLNSSSAEMKDGAGELKDGADEIKDKTGDMDQKVDDEVDNALSKYTGEGFEARSFVDERNEVELVQFVIKTAAIEIPEADTPAEEEPEEEDFIDRVKKLFDGWGQE